MTVGLPPGAETCENEHQPTAKASQSAEANNNRVLDIRANTSPKRKRLPRGRNSRRDRTAMRTDTLPTNIYLIAERRTSVAVSQHTDLSPTEGYLCARGRVLAGLASPTSIPPHTDDRLAHRSMEGLQTRLSIWSHFAWSMLTCDCKHAMLRLILKKFSSRHLPSISIRDCTACFRPNSTTGDMFDVDCASPVVSPLCPFDKGGLYISGVSRAAPRRCRR